MARELQASIFLPTRAGAVAERVRELIRSGELAPGTPPAPGRDCGPFRSQLNAGREAFIALEREGLLRRHRHRGVVVFMPSVEELNELYQIRAVLEPLATEIAAKQLIEDDLVALERVVAEMRTARPKRFVELNDELHARIYDAADRPRLREIVDGLREPAANYISMNVDLYDRTYRAEVQAEHEALLEALRSRAAKRRRAPCASTSSTVGNTSCH